MSHAFREEIVTLLPFRLVNRGPNNFLFVQSLSNNFVLRKFAFSKIISHNLRDRVIFDL